MLITDFSEQNINNQQPTSKVSLPELATAGMIFVLPIIFLLVIAAG